MATMADGIAVGRPGDVPFAIVAELVDDVRTVSEESLSRALLLCLERAKLVVEPAGAAAVAGDPRRPGSLRAARRRRAVRRQHRPAAAAAGDPARARGGRPLPGAARAGAGPARATWPGCSATLATTDANVLEVEHLRTDAGLRVDEVEIDLQLEMRGPEHCDEVVELLRAEGYGVHEGSHAQVAY